MYKASDKCNIAILIYNTNRFPVSKNYLQRALRMKSKNGEEKKKKKKKEPKFLCALGRTHLCFQMCWFGESESQHK